LIGPIRGLDGVRQNAGIRKITWAWVGNGKFPRNENNTQGLWKNEKNSLNQLGSILSRPEGKPLSSGDMGREGRHSSGEKKKPK